MGILEKESKQKSRRALVQKIILGTVATAGLLAVVAVAPNALQALRLFGVGKSKKYGYYVNRARGRLLELGLLEYVKEERGTFLRLTEKGRQKLRLLELHDYKLKKPRRWDGKYRLIIFDIKEERKGTREKIRVTLRRIGFFRLQDSVWVYPYDCEDLIMLLKADFKIGKDVLYVIAEKIENDASLRSKFSLPPRKK